MRVNLLEVLTLSHISGIQRPILVYNKANYRISALDIFFYSENWTAYDNIILPPITPKITVEIEGILYPIKQGNPGSSPLHPIVWKRDSGLYEEVGITETLHTIQGNLSSGVRINIINNMESDSLLNGWGGTGSHQTGWGGDLTDSDTYDTGWGGAKPDILQYLNEIICVIQPSIYEDKELSENLIVENGLTSIFL